MELFKKLMGIPAGMYDIFRDFKRRVLDKAVDEVNMYSDLLITAELVKEGRKVVRVRFKLKDRARKTRLGKSAENYVPALPAQLPLKDKLMTDFMFSDMQATQIINEYETAFIEEKIHLVASSRPFKQGKVQNPAAYLLSALKKDYKKQTKEQTKVVSIESRNDEQDLVDLKRKVTAVYQQYQEYREEVIHHAIDNQEETAKAAFMEQFRRFAEPTIAAVMRLQKSKYTRETVLHSPHLQALLRQFAMRELDSIALMSAEEFVAMLDQHSHDAWHKLKSLDPDHPLLRCSEKVL